MWKKVITAMLMLIILCSASFYSGMKYSNNREFNKDRKYYLNYIYAQIDPAIFLLSTIDDWSSNTNSADFYTYRQLLGRINSIKIASEQARQDINAVCVNNFAHSFDLIENIIEYGIIYNNEKICNGFLNDGVLSNNEILFLTSLKQDLQNIKTSLYSDETKQENPNLSLERLAEIIKPFSEKYSVSNLHNMGLRN